MCDICGCGDPSKPRFIVKEIGNNIEDRHTHDHTHDHEDHHHSHAAEHHHDHEQLEIEVQRDILNKNQMFAERNRGYFEAKSVKAFNLVSSPGSGKTTLLEEAIRRVGGAIKIFVVEGDQQGTLDADRISALDVPVIQINTGKSCHLDAEAVGLAVKQLEPEQGSLVFIENVGNLMCPSLFDLGENYRVVLLSTPEGEDKPLKYPDMFYTSHVCVISKTDIAEPCGFSIKKAAENAFKVNPGLRIFEVSAKTGEGMDELANWIREVSGDK